MPNFPVTGASDTSTVTIASAQFTPTMVAGQVWLFLSNTDCYISQGANPTAAAADGNMFVPARMAVEIEGDLGAKLAVIRDTADGRASLTRIKRRS